LVAFEAMLPTSEAHVKIISRCLSRDENSEAYNSLERDKEREKRNVFLKSFRNQTSITKPSSLCGES
jgi:hypothetical protein